MSDQHAPSFAAWIAEHRNGLADADLSDALRSLVDAVTRYDKAGKLTLTITIKRSGDTVMVTDVVAVKLPQPPPDERHYFVDENGALTRRNPLQPSLSPAHEETLR